MGMLPAWDMEQLQGLEVVEEEVDLIVSMSQMVLILKR